MVPGVHASTQSGASLPQVPALAQAHRAPGLVAPTTAASPRGSGLFATPSPATGRFDPDGLTRAQRQGEFARQQFDAAAAIATPITAGHGVGTAMQTIGRKADRKSTRLNSSHLGISY